MPPGREMVLVMKQIGLVVVKNLTEANGGTVKVESEVGKGTTFTVVFPV